MVSSTSAMEARDEAGIIVHHFDRYVFRQVFLQLLDTLVGFIGNFDLVGARLRDDDVDNHRFAVLAHHASQIFRAYLGSPYVLEADDIVAVTLDDQIIEFRCCMHQS